MTRKPNFLVILADDLGFSDLKCFGGEIDTPNLDALAADGIRMTDFHTASACSPTRSMLFSGTDNHLAGLGQMAESMARAKKNPFKGRAGYEGVLNQKVAALSEVLQDGGYETIMSGKWHLGMTGNSVPAERGFDQVFALLCGSSNHYGYEPTLQNGVPIAKIVPAVYMENKDVVPVTSLKSFYSSTYFVDKLLTYIEQRDTRKPFCSYLAFTAPHWPLQASEKAVAKYRGRYDDGPEVLRHARLHSMKKLGLIAEDTTISPMADCFGYKHWRDMTSDEQALEARKMEVYAAMVETMDQELGRVIQRLKEIGEYDNTFIFFASDNGAEGALLEAIPLFGEVLQDSLSTHYDNSLANIGRANSYTWIGPRWAQAATAPSRMFKCWNTEGGVRCPAIVSYGPLTNGRGGAIRHEFATVMDIMPTILDLAALDHPAPEFHGRAVLPMRGKSWIPCLSGKAPCFHNETAVHGWELFGQAAIRRGHWKALWIPAPAGKNTWELYDLSKDKGETEDLAESHPDIVAEMVDHWRLYEAETGTLLVTPEDDGFPGGSFGWYQGFTGFDLSA